MFFWAQEQRNYIFQEALIKMYIMTSCHILCKGNWLLLWKTREKAIKISNIGYPNGRKTNENDILHILCSIFECYNHQIHVLTTKDQNIKSNVCILL